MRIAGMSCSLVVLVALACGCNAASDVSRELGARCVDHDECKGLCLADPAFPDGFCSLNCNVSDDCPRASACVDVAQGVCLFTCAEDADCTFLGDGWRCALTPGLPSGEVLVCTGP